MSGNICPVTERFITQGLIFIISLGNNPPLLEVHKICTMSLCHCHSGCLKTKLRVKNT